MKSRQRHRLDRIVREAAARAAADQAALEFPRQADIVPSVPKYRSPSVYIEEASFRPPPIEGVATDVAAFIGKASRGPKRPTLVTSLAEYLRRFGAGGPFLPAAIRGFFENGGRRAYVCRLTPKYGLADRLGALKDQVFDEVALIAAPGLTGPATAAALIAHCEAHRRFAVLDLPRGDPRPQDPRAAHPSRNAACYAPWLHTATGTVPPSGAVLGIYARVDGQSGVWKALANEVVRGFGGLEHALGRDQQAPLNERGVNLIRHFPGAASGSGARGRSPPMPSGNM